MKKIDMLGKPCPIPVIEAKKVLSQQESLGVILLVDNIVAVQNLEKMAKGMHFGFSYTTESIEHYTVTITNSETKQEHKAVESREIIERDSHRGATVLITDEKMGTGSEELGKILIKGFIYSLGELETVPENVIFLNAGIKLTVSGANTVEDLKALENMGTKIMVCGTCLNFYGLTEETQVGEVVNMFDITALLDSAERVISL